MLENLNRRDVALGLFLEVDEDAVDVGGAVVDVVVERRVVEQQTEGRIGRVELCRSEVEVGRNAVDVAHCRVEGHILQVIREYGESR